MKADPSFRFKYVLFDFDGTLADSTSVSIEVYNELASENGFLPINDSNYHYLRSLPIREMIRELKVPVFKIPELLIAGRKRSLSRIDSIQPFHEVFEAARRLKETKAPVGIFSTNSQEMIQSFLKKHGYTDLFTPIVAGGGFLGKRRKLLKFLKQTGLRPEETLYVGDEVRDIDSVHSVGMQMAAVTWGVNEASVLNSRNPAFLINEPAKLAEILCGESGNI